jgi:hypothetical protein
VSLSCPPYSNWFAQHSPYIHTTFFHAQFTFLPYSWRLNVLPKHW